ncbi:hypothetical protein [Streptomyces specialis]|uniref:hypothetical protein n=1 Tax=Streptomyces specialis TaxID=498367 RepID=UPI00073F4A2F|nr:hypothetical protein [Streptomyces specialis]
MTDTAEVTEEPGPARPPVNGREVKRLTRRIRSFSAAHGGQAEGQIAYLGTRGYRLVLVGSDGAWGDVVNAHREALEEAARQSRVELRETFDGDLAARVKTGPYEWSRMAGIQIGGPSNNA